MRTPQKDWANQTYYCDRCGRQVYQAKRGPSGPGQAQYAAKGLCTRCYKLDGRDPVKAWGLSKREGPGYTQCLECARPMSPATSRVEGTAVYRSGGRCAACVRREQYRAEHPEAGTTRLAIDWSVEQECATCGRPLRPAGRPADGKTVAHFAHGMCRTCVQGVGRANRKKLGTGLAVPDKGLERLLAERRARKKAAARRQGGRAAA